MAHVSPYNTPLGSSSGLNNNKSLFHDFVRPRGQFSSKLTSSPFKGSPQSETIDFIPLGFSSPVNNRSRNGNNSWRGNNRKNFSGSPANSSFGSYNSSYSPYSMNRNHVRNNSSSPSFGSCNDSDRRNFSYRKKRGNNFLVNPGRTDNIDLYYHPSMLEDPWAELEQKLQTRMAEQNYSLGSKNTIEKSVSNLSSVDSVFSLSDSDEGADSQETDSTVSVSDGSS